MRFCWRLRNLLTRGRNAGKLDHGLLQITILTRVTTMWDDDKSIVMTTSSPSNRTGYSWIACQSTTSLWRWNRYRVPKHRPTTIWRRGNTQKNIFNVKMVYCCPTISYSFKFYKNLIQLRHAPLAVKVQAPRCLWGWALRKRLLLVEWHHCLFSPAVWGAESATHQHQPRRWTLVRQVSVGSLISMSFYL